MEDGEGSTIGEVQQRWHLWQRNYDLYIDRKQYATINSGLWAWEFLLKDKDGGDVLAECTSIVTMLECAVMLLVNLVLDCDECTNSLVLHAYASTQTCPLAGKLAR